MNFFFFFRELTFSKHVQNTLKACLLGSWAAMNIIWKEANIDMSERLRHSMNESEFPAAGFTKGLQQALPINLVRHSFVTKHSTRKVEFWPSFALV